jgi:methyl-accepting chemotaxis protein
MIRRLKLFWKLSLLAALIPLSVGVGMAVSLHGVRQLGAEYDNLYGLMRLPLMALDEANTRREALEGDLWEMARPDLSSEQRMLLVQRIRENDRAMATHESNTRAQAVIDRTVSRFLLTGLLLSLIGILVAWGLSRRIARPLEGLIRLPSGLSQDEFEMLMSELRESVHMLVDISSLMSSHAREVAAGSAEVAAHIDDILPGLINVLHGAATQTAEQCRQLEQLALQGEQDAERRLPEGVPSLRETTLFAQHLVG